MAMNFRYFSDFFFKCTFILVFKNFPSSPNVCDLTRVKAFLNALTMLGSSSTAYLNVVQGEGGWLL